MATGRKLVLSDVGKLIVRTYRPDMGSCVDVDTLTWLRAIVGDRLIVDCYTLGNCGVRTSTYSKKNTDNWIACETLHDAVWIALINYTVIYNRDPTLYRKSRCWYTGPLVDFNSFCVWEYDGLVLAYTFSRSLGLNYTVLSDVPAPAKTYKHLWQLIREEQVPRARSPGVDELLAELNVAQPPIAEHQDDWDMLESTIITANV